MRLLSAYWNLLGGAHGLGEFRRNPMMAAAFSTNSGSCVHWLERFSL
jgi:hypothetical protein